MKKYLDRAKIESIHGELYNPFSGPDSELRSNYCISDQGKIFLLEHVQNLGIIKDNYVELKVQIYNTSTNDAVIESVRVSYERGPLDTLYLPEFLIPPLNYHNFSHRIPAISLPPDFYILILSFFVRGENSEKLKIYFSVPTIQAQINEPYDADQVKDDVIESDRSDKAVIVNAKSDNIRITLPRGNAVGVFNASSGYRDSRYLLASFDDSSEVMIPPSGEHFSLKSASFIRSPFRLHDDKGRAVNTLTGCEVVLDRDLNIYFKKISAISSYKFYIMGYSHELQIHRKSNQLKIHQITQVAKRKHLLVFSRTFSGDAFILIKDKAKTVRIDIEFEDDIQPVRVLDVSTVVEEAISGDPDTIQLAVPLRLEGIGRLGVDVNENLVRHRGKITSKLIDPWDYTYDLTVPVSLFDLNGNLNLSLGFTEEDGASARFDVLCKYESKSRLFLDSQIGPIILSYGVIQEKHVKINLLPGEEITGCEIKLTGTQVNGTITPVQNDRAFIRLNEIMEYSYFENFLVLRFSCFSPPDEYLSKLDLSVTMQTNTSKYTESLSVLIFYYEGKSKFLVKQNDTDTILKCSNIGEEQLIIYRVCAHHRNVYVDHLSGDTVFPVKIEAYESKSFTILGTDKIKDPVELSVFYNNPTPKIIKLEA